MKLEEIECCLTFDEMSKKEGLQYDVSSSCLRGDVTLTDHSRVATYAIALMFSGIATCWKYIITPETLLMVLHLSNYFYMS